MNVERSAMEAAESFIAAASSRPDDVAAEREEVLAQLRAALAAREEPQPTREQGETARYLTAVLGDVQRDGVVSATRGDREFFLRPDGTLESGIMELNQVEVEGLPHRVGVKHYPDEQELRAALGDALLWLERIPPPEEEIRVLGRGLWDETLENARALLAAREDTERPDEPVCCVEHSNFLCSLSLGHDGPHKGEGDDGVVLHEWPQGTEQEHERRVRDDPGFKVDDGAVARPSRRIGDEAHARKDTER